MAQDESRLITVAIHTYEKAVALRSLLESEGIDVVFHNVNLEQPSVSSGIRVRIHESDLPLALRIIENHEIFIVQPDANAENSQSRHILVPVDFSATTIDIVETAAAIASRHKASLKLLNTYIDPLISGDGIQLSDNFSYDLIDAEARQKIADDAAASMKQLEAEIKKNMKEGIIAAVKFTTEVVEGVPEDAILACAKETNPLMIIMGTRRLDKKEREMVGSVAAEVLDGSRVPVLSIPQNLPTVSGGKLSQILFLANNDQDDILAMDCFVRMFDAADAEVSIVALPARHRWYEKGRQQSADALAKYFRDNYKDLRFESINVGDDNAIEAISSLHNRHNFDMVIVPNKRKRNILNRLFNQSLAHKIIFNTDVAVFVVPI